jgi:ADP-ribosylglycohydrolase
MREQSLASCDGVVRHLCSFAVVRLSHGPRAEDVRAELDDARLTVSIGEGEATPPAEARASRVTPRSIYIGILGARIGGGPFRLQAGEWTDDTSMALCLAESLVECVRFDPVDQLDRYCRWWRDGHLSSTGRCFDIGSTVRAALARFEQTGESYCGSTDPNSAGNGSLMRLAPVPMFFAQDAHSAVERAGESSRTTHAAPTAVAACRYMAGLVVGALRGESKDALLAPRYAPEGVDWDDQSLADEVEIVALGSFLAKEPPEIRGTGYVVESLEAALWALSGADSFRDGALAAVNLGADADTTGAVYGQLAGAIYDEAAIPESWKQNLACRELIERYADKLHELAHRA